VDKCLEEKNILVSTYFILLKVRKCEKNLSWFVSKTDEDTGISRNSEYHKSSRPSSLSTTRTSAILARFDFIKFALSIHVIQLSPTRDLSILFCRVQLFYRCCPLYIFMEQILFQQKIIYFHYFI